jgi:ubiquinone/menaquinone biosynthesis C-methylase UbiE
MVDYNKTPTQKFTIENIEIASFVTKENSGNDNIDWKTVESFGEEWNKFDFFNDSEIENIGNDYFDIVNSQMMNKNSKVLDVGCGSGRWIKYVANKVQFVEGIDPSNAVFTAAKFLHPNTNIRITHSSIDTLPFPDSSFDFVYSLGVLHHIPETKKAMQKCVEKLKPGGAFLVYLYYSLDNRGFLFKLIFHLSNLIRFFVSKLPSKVKMISCDFLAIVLYYPFILLSSFLDLIPFLKKFSHKIPLAWYKGKSFKIIRNDSLDRFGTPLEQRFSKKEIENMMKECGLENILFSNKEPFWHAVGLKK